MAQHHLLGQILRNRYVTSTDFLNENYTRAQVHPSYCWQMTPLVDALTTSLNCDIIWRLKAWWGIVGGLGAEVISELKLANTLLEARVQIWALNPECIICDWLPQWNTTADLAQPSLVTTFDIIYKNASIIQSLLLEDCIRMTYSIDYVILTNMASYYFLLINTFSKAYRKTHIKGDCTTLLTFDRITC